MLCVRRLNGIIRNNYQSPREREMVILRMSQSGLLACAAGVKMVICYRLHLVQTPRNIATHPENIPQNLNRALIWRINCAYHSVRAVIKLV
jgi:hypothetical protein